MKNLDDVLRHLQTCDDDSCDHSSLPLFAHRDFGCPAGVWSWDADSKIIGTHRDDFEIVNISDREKRAKYITATDDMDDDDSQKKK